MTDPIQPPAADAGRHAQSEAEADRPAAGPGAGSGGRFPQWGAPAALVLAVVGTLLSLWSLKTASDNAPGAKLAGDSKVRVCSAFATVSKAVSLQTHGGAEPLPEPLAAANSRQALLAGGQYLLQQIDAKTPGNLADAATAFANDIQTLGLNYLGGAVSTDPAQADLIKRADSGMTSVADLCD